MQEIRDTIETSIVQILGIVPAGLLTEVFEDKRYAVVPGKVPKDCVALKVRGFSMVEAGIQDGDLVLIQRQSACENGQIAVVRMDGSYTLKRVFFLEGGKVLLVGSNFNQVVQDSVEIWGVYCGSISGREWVEYQSVLNAKK